MKTRMHLCALTLCLLVGACATQSAGERLDDAALQARVSRALLADPNAARLGVDADVVDAVVYLSGEVDTEEEKVQVEKVAANTRGVKGVRNDLQVEGAVAENERSDIAIRNSLGWLLRADPDVRRRDVDVDVDNGVVTLKGMVRSEREKESAVRIARGVDGVREVNDRLVLEEDLEDDEDTATRDRR